jgi:translation initiation factor RLI1
VNEMQCIGCGKCKRNCFWNAIEIVMRSHEEAQL